MPNIVQYDATGEITPSDRGIQAAEVAGRRLGLYGHELAQQAQQIGDAVERHQAVMETSELYKTGAQLKLNLQQRYEQESALPENRNDPHFGDKFMAEVGPLIDQWGSSVKTDHGKMLAAEMGGQIRNEVFNHVAAGQSEMDSAHVIDNGKTTMNTLGAGLITDPSEINLDRTLGTARDTIDGMTMSIPDVATRERVATELRDQYFPQLVLSRYQGVKESAKNQIANTGGETSPALEQMDKDIANQVGFQYLTPEQQSRLPELRDEALRQGQELYKSKNETAKAQTAEQGKAAYAELHNELTNQALRGLPPTPDQVAAAQEYSRRFGVSNPGEVASLDDFLVRGADRAQEDKVQPYNQQVRDNIQAGFGLPKGDPRRPTLASLMQAYSHGQITPEDLSRDTEILNKLDKPETDPTFKAAYDDFRRWQSTMVQSIGQKDGPGTATARAMFLHDSEANFMARGHNLGDWNKALDYVTDANNPHSFYQALHFYKDASVYPNADQWLQQHGLRFNEDGTVGKPAARGSIANPIVPTRQTPAPATQAPASADEVKKADAIIWGKPQ